MIDVIIGLVFGLAFVVVVVMTALYFSMHEGGPEPKPDPLWVEAMAELDEIDALIAGEINPTRKDPPPGYLWVAPEAIKKHDHAPTLGELAELMKRRSLSGWSITDFEYEKVKRTPPRNYVDKDGNPWVMPT